VSACFIDINTFKSFINGNGAFSYEIIVELCRNELSHFKRCINQVQKQSPGRVAEALLAFSKDIFHSDSFTLPLTQSELGDLTGCSRENVSRILSNFSHENTIKTSGREITIVNKNLLEQVSKLG
ncbi:MAG: winged helix-turn-helix domain-containing protein, partial [Bacteroidales bacterium]|nr:winged helix-turn-helix domain-containing protein [Bacteroidales bacterium]